MPQTIIDIDPSTPIADSLKQLQLPPSPLIFLLGDFPASCSGPAASIFQRAVAPVALEVGAIIVDDAKCCGCAAAIASAAIDQDRTPQLLGIVSNDRQASDIDPNHQQIVRLPAAWDHSAKYTLKIADVLASQSVPKRAVALLFGGTDEHKKSIVQCARLDWPVIVVAKTGGLADQIIAAMTTQPDGTLPAPPLDPDLREIVETATVYQSTVDGNLDDLRRQLFAQVDSSAALETLKQAWERFDELDLTALRKQTLFRRIEGVLIVLAVVAALLAILTRVIGDAFPLHLMVIIAPILISVIGAYNSHFRDGNKWILLRGAAEALKREIFRFRAKAGIYSDEQCELASRESKLAAKLKDILSALEQSEVNKTSLTEDPRPDPKRISFLSPEQYVVERLGDQINYFVSKTRKLSRKLTAIQLFIYLAGGIGTLLAAIHLDIWVAVATAVVTAFTTKLQADQTETSLIQYNQSLASLRNIDCWWRALSGWEKSRRKNIDVLVDQTEKAMESETAGWVQQMQAALDKLTEKEPPAQNQ